MTFSSGGRGSGGKKWIPCSGGTAQTSLVADKFKTGNIYRYDGSINPEEFI
jgi:hypothetical protein